MTVSVRRADHTPVIVGVGEVIDRVGFEPPREPARLMAEAIRSAEADSGARLLEKIVSIDMVQQISWPYPDSETRLAQELGFRPAHMANGPTGGESPIRYLHQAALRIAEGEPGVFVVCGAEAEASVRHARRDGHSPLPWSPADTDFKPIRAAASQRQVVQELGAAIPTNVYPLYESALRARLGQSFSEAQAESALLWAQLSRLADTRECSWQTRPYSMEEIATPSETNRMIAWPYSKLMVANPMVNQGAAILVTSRSEALEMGIRPERLVYILGGCAAEEPGDILLRTSYDRSEAMSHALSGAIAISKREGHGGFDHVELYSCFPCVPKMARRELGLADDIPISVTGGLTFFGAPLNNYMSHAAAAMVERLRSGAGSIGLLYGQGGYVTRHHALVLSSVMPANPLGMGSSESAHVASFDGLIIEHADGAARLEAATVLFDRSGRPTGGICIARTEGGCRAIGGVLMDDGATLARMMDTENEPIGRLGFLHTQENGPPHWRFL